MASQNRDIVVNIISDASEFLKGYEQAIAELEKYAKKADIASGMQHQINELKEDIKEMSVALKNIAVNNIDTKQLDDLGKKLELQEYKIKQLQKDKNKIKIQVDELSVKKINDIVGQAENIVDQLIEKVQTLNQLGINIQTESTKNNSDEIKELSAKLNELQLKKEQLSKGNDFSSLNTEEAIAKLKELQKQSTLLYDELGKLGKNTLQRDNKIIEIGQISKDIQVLQNQLKDTGRLKLDDLIDEDFIREDINEAENIISNFITQIKTEISGLTSNTQIDASSLQLKDGKISVKLDIDTTAEKLRQQAKTLIQEVQTEVWKTPLMVPLKFTSSYKTKALEELKVFEDTLHSMSDSQEKTALVSQLDNLKKQLNARDFRIDFKTNIDTLEKNISTGLTNIQTLLKNAKLYVYPEVVIDEASKKKIQDTLNEISKSLNLDINIEKILGEEDRKKIQESLQGIKIELTPNVKLTDKDIENINKKLARQLSKLNIGINTTELQSELSNTFSDTVIEKWGNKFISVIENLSHMFQRVFNVASDTDISNQWSKLQEQFNSFAKDDGNFDARKKEVVELIQEYQKYLDMGGKDPIANLTGNKKGQDKLTAQYNKYLENQKKVAQDSAKAIEEENKALEKTEKVAKKSAQAKEEFTQANQGVKKSAKQSAESIKEEVKEIQNVDNVINDNKNSTHSSSSATLSNQQNLDVIVNQIKQEQEIIEETGVVATNTAQLVAQAEDVKQKEYKETANALEVLRKAQVGTADIFQKTQSNFDFTNPHLQAKEWFEAYANSISQAEGLSESKYTIHTDANQNFKYATIEYYNEALKQTITETWEWHKANQKVAGDTDRMVVSNIKFVDNIKARYTQEKKDTETMSTALRKANEALTSFDSKTQGKLKGNEKYKELAELLSNGFKDLKDVERAQQLMNELNVELNNINADARRGSASFDIFSNMVKGISEADNKVKLLTIDYQSLTNVSDDVTQKFEKLLQSLSALKNAQGVESQAKAYGDYREALNEATYAIRVFKKEQSLIDKTTKSYQRDTLLSEDVDIQKLQLDKLHQSLKSSGLLTDELSLKFEKLYTELEQVDSAYTNNLWKKSFQQFEFNIEPISKMAKDFEKINDKLSFLPNAEGKIGLYNQKIQEIVNSIVLLRQSITQLDVTDDTLYTDGVLDAEKYNAKIQEIIKSITDLNKASIQYNIQNNAGGNKGVLLENTVGMIHNTKDVADALREYAQANKLGKEIGIKDDDINQVSIAFKNQDGVITKLTGKIVDFADKSEDAAKAIRLVTDRTSGAIGLFGNFGSVLGKFGKQILIYYFSLHDFIRYFRNGITVVKEFDAAMTELIKVSNDPEEALFAFEKEAFNIAETIGSTGKEIINSAADWEKLGYAIADASELAKNSALYANVGDMDIDTATEHMISTLKAFNIEASESIQVVDKFNEIGNNYAITSEGIGAALERSAASLVAAGNDIDESIALITAGNIISQDAESVGNAIKVLSLRIRGSKSELEEMGEETDGLADSTSKLRNELKALTGVDIMLDDSTYKSTYEIILEISKVWDKLTDVSQATVLEKLAGKTRASVVAGLLQQGETLEEVFYRSQDAEGSALKENQNYLESIQGHLDKLTNKWQEMWTNAINRDTANFFIDLGTKILDVINNIGVFRSTLLGLGGVLAFKAKGGGRAKKAVPLLS